MLGNIVVKHFQLVIFIKKVKIMNKKKKIQNIENNAYEQ